MRKRLILRRGPRACRRLLRLTGMEAVMFHLTDTLSRRGEAAAGPPKAAGRLRSGPSSRGPIVESLSRMSP